MPTVYDHLKTLQITLPDIPPSVVDGYVAAFVPFVRTGTLIHFSGRVAKKDGKLWVGKLGAEITAAEGKQAARGVAIELLAALQGAIGDLNHVWRIVKLVVFVNSAPHFTEPDVVANGASELLLEVFGDRGAHARSALSVSQIPFGCCAIRREHSTCGPREKQSRELSRIRKALTELPRVEVQEVSTPKRIVASTRGELIGRLDNDTLLVLCDTEFTTFHTMSGTTRRTGIRAVRRVWLR